MERCLFFFLLFCSIFAVFGQQQRNDLAFVSEIPALDPNFIKSYQTTVRLNSTGNDTEATLNEALTQVITSYYNSSVMPIQYPIELTNTSLNNVTYTFSYVVSYNFSSLSNLNNDEIVTAVSNETVVRNAFEADANFSNNFIWVGGFTVSGNDICTGATCNTYATCISNSLGNYVDCTSQCRSQQKQCFNNAYCVQTDGNSQPYCSCVSSANNWFVGSECKTMLNLWMPIVYFVVVFLLIVLVIVVTCCCIKGIQKRIEKEKRKAFIKASKEREQPMSKNQKVFVTIKSALGIKKSKEKSEDKEAAKEEAKSATPPPPPAEEVTELTPPKPAPRTMIPSSQDSTHEPTSSSSSEINYAPIQLPVETEEDRRSEDSFSSREEDADERYMELMEERLADLPQPGAGNVNTPPYQEPVAYAVVNKRPRRADTLESTV